MDAPPPITPTRTAGPTLLVGPGGDVIPLDLCGVEPADIERRVATPTGSGLIVAVQGRDAAAAVAAAAAGALVVVDGEGEGVGPGLDRARALALAGVPVDQLLVEVAWGPGALPASTIHQVTEAGWAVVVVLQAPDRSGAEAIEGWQIGALAQVLTLGVRAVRGVAPERFRRVAAVVAALATTGDVGARR